MDYPKYDKNDPPYVYINKLKDFEYELKREKYNIVFSFIDEIAKIINIKIKSLIDFKNINRNSLIKNKIVIKLIKKKYKSVLTKLNLSYEFDDDIYELFNVMLNPIGYKLIRKNIDDDKLYNIIELK
jgi:hypothetical protein